MLSQKVLIQIIQGAGFAVRITADKAAAACGKTRTQVFILRLARDHKKYPPREICLLDNIAGADV